ncbi:hypothetical protein G6F68_020250 [Rhizopus microsporus]|nr:hypothetical protein G6F68_020250 [Rhizopus microsporus]
MIVKKKKLIKKSNNLTLSCIVHDERGKILLDGQEEVEEEELSDREVYGLDGLDEEEASEEEEEEKEELKDAEDIEGRNIYKKVKDIVLTL